jgi:hypothetical protein
MLGERQPTVHYVVTELSVERRTGYSWYNNRAVGLESAYAKWKAALGK